MKETRLEHDLLGEKEIPCEAYYGIQTLRAHINFKNISGVQLKRYSHYIESLAMVKWAAASANHDLGLLDTNIYNAIKKACEEIIDGKLHNQFIVDMVQGGAGTSTNMNANEVIANRALEIMGHKKGEYEFCHPNNHVNLSQSTNDAYPTAFRIAFWLKNQDLLKSLKSLIKAMKKKEDEFSGVIKMGRTQLQDAVPMTLGQEFGAFTATLEEEVTRLSQMADLFLEVNMGATAIGSGINSEPGYSRLCIQHLRNITGLNIQLASNLFEATYDTGSYVIYSSAMKRLSVKLSKICNDLRLLSSGPRCGINEINLPKMQPGSSIMPGKVNPVIPELMNQICFKVIGNDMTVTMASEAGQLQLNVMEPIIVSCIFESVVMLSKGMINLTKNCIVGITANEEYCRQQVMNSIGIVTALNPTLGYETSSRIAKKALAENKSVYDLILEEKLLTKNELDEILSIDRMIAPSAFIHKKNS
ncbi:MAG: aspartate ammonia-lyase [Bacteroidales bacterium]